MVRSRRQPPRPSTPATPATPATTHLAALPPTPQSPAYPTSDDESTPDHLDESFYIVSDGESSSLRDSEIDNLSEPGAWEDDDDGDNGEGDKTLLDGEYTDAEATATEMSQSMDTNSITASQIRLIMPNPEASFLADSAYSSMGTTPSASMANILQVPYSEKRKSGLRRTGSPGKNGAAFWVNSLEKSREMWISPEEEKRLLGDIGEYRLLASEDSLNKSPVSEEESKLVNSVSADSGIRLKRFQGKLGKEDVARLRVIAKKWSVRASVLALASILSITLLGTYGRLRIVQTGDTALPVPASEHTEVEPTSLWDRLTSTSFLPLSSSVESAGVPLATQLIPDLQLIKQALSTFSTTTNSHKDVVPSVITTESTPATTKEVDVKLKIQTTRSSTSSSSALSIRNDAMTLTTDLAAVDGSWHKIIRRKGRRNATEANIAQQTAHATLPCECSVSPQVPGDMMRRAIIVGNRARRVLAPAKQRLVMAAWYLDQIYGPALVELYREIGEVVALAKTLAETSSTLTQFILHRAARGVTVSRYALESFRRYIPLLSPPNLSQARDEANHAAQEALALARSSVDALSEYVDEQTLAMHANLRQAKKGLDKLIKAAGLESTTGKGEVRRTDVSADGPMPFGQMSSTRVKRSRKTGHREHVDRGVGHDKMGKKRFRINREKEKNGQKQKVRQWPKMEKASRGQKFWDMIHHGAVALVV